MNVFKICVCVLTVHEGVKHLSFFAIDCYFAFFKVCSTTCHSKMDPDSIDFKMLEYIYSFSVRKHQSTQLKPYAM